MKRVLAVAAIATLAACQTLPAIVVTGADTFDVRYDDLKTTAQEADARAAALCNGPPQFVQSGTGFDGFQYRSYRCQRK